MSHYLHRTLRFIDDEGRSQFIGDTELSEARTPIVILGEPGMGKTELLRYLADQPGCVFRSAASFVNHPNPAALLRSGATLLIDGLDELSAAQESDPVYRVLGKLIEAGCPPFIMTCRAADWRGAIARQDISVEYGVPPRQMWLEPFSRNDAIEFLSAQIGQEKAETLISRLEQRGVRDVYGNPLTLDLFASVAAADDELPATRSKLLQRASELMSRETSDRRHRSALATLDTNSALAAAGALSAAFVLVGAEAIALNPSGALAPGTLPLAEVGVLADPGHIRAVLDSRLFAPVPGTDDRFKPIHRSIAEFLGARWLVGMVEDELACDRLLAMMTVDGGVPASLRGIHAWLAQDPRLALRVIGTDPYGVLRYGDADCLTVEQGRELLRALRLLQDTDPYFRAGDWDSLSAEGLTQIELLDDVREILIAENTGFHLRTSLLSVIRASELATLLSIDLERILFNVSGSPLTYPERYDSALVLATLHSHREKLGAIVSRLLEAGDDESVRLALDIMQEVGYRDFSGDDVAAAIVAYLGLSDGTSNANSDPPHSTDLFGTAQAIPDSLVAPVLDSLARRLPQRDPMTAPPVSVDLATLVTHLITRQLRRDTPAPLCLLRWLRIIAGSDGYMADDEKQLTEFIRYADSTRRAFQSHILLDEDGEPTWNRLWRLGDINPALSLNAEDVVHHLAALASTSSRTPGQIALWKELAAFARGLSDAAPRIIEAARPFAGTTPELESYLAALLQPLPTPQWEIDRSVRREARAAEKATAYARHRAEFGERITEIQAGELNSIHPLALAYFGLFSDISRELPPADRIGAWLGPDLQAAALFGFEAVLKRPDLPTLQQIGESYAQSRRWNFALPMIAGVVERIRHGRALDDIAPDVISAVRVAIENEHLDGRGVDRAIVGKIEIDLWSDEERYERYLRWLIEPSLVASRNHIPGLYAFARSDADKPLAKRLAAEWLDRFPDLPHQVESELTDVLLRAGDTASLKRLYRNRSGTLLQDMDRTRAWQALGLLVDFKHASISLPAVSPEHRDLLWHIRDRVGSERKPQYDLANQPETLAWIVAQFRSLWPHASDPLGTTWGNTNAWDASQFLVSIINRLASDTADRAVDALRKLIDSPKDAYTPILLHAYNQQRHSRRELAFSGIALDHLRDIIHARSPRTTGDLLAVVLFALHRLQSQLNGNDTDIADKYWTDQGTPRDERTCTDRLIEDLERTLPIRGVARTPERDMPKGKRADIVFTAGDASLPVECKSQWNNELWTAASLQLDALYLRDWRSQDRGLYIVYWFGPHVPPNRALRKLQRKDARPASPQELRRKLLDRLPAARHRSIAIEVLDLSRK
jgi:hypothetical protein